MSVLDEIREQYPTLAFLVNDPEVGPLLRDAVDPNKGFSPQTFQAKLYQTKWFRTRSTTQREMSILARTDPGEYKRRLQQQISDVRSQAQLFGLNLTPSELRYMATTNLSKGIAADSAEFRSSLRNWLKTKKSGSKTFGQGSVLAAKQQVKGLAREQFYVPMSEKEAHNWGVALALGTRNEEGLKLLLNQRAQQLYPHLRELLRSGSTMEDIFSGHRALIAEELELSPEMVDFRKDWSKVLQQVDPQSGKPRPMTLHETQTLARQDQRWWRTSKGREADAGMANFMLKTFGKRA